MRCYISKKLWSSTYGEVPSIDLLESKVSAWENTGSDIIDNWRLASDGDGIICPKCKEDFWLFLIDKKRYHYCPNCGKKLNFPDFIIKKDFENEYT